MPEPPRKKDRPLAHYAYYSNMAIEMGLIIAIGVFGGIKLDKWLHLSPLFTIVCSLAGIGIALYVVLKDFIPSKKQHQDEKNRSH